MENKVLNPFDATGAISLHPHKKNYINRTVPFFTRFISKTILRLLGIKKSE